MSGNVIMPMTVQDLECVHLSLTISIEAMKKECAVWAEHDNHKHATTKMLDSMYSALYRAEEMQARILKALHKAKIIHVA